MDGDNFTYHCFNCNFKCRFELGKTISRNLRQLMRWCNVEDDQINRWSLESLQHKDLIDYVKVKRKKLKIKFNEHELPEGCELLSTDNETHSKFVEYLENRGLSVTDYPFMVTPHEAGRNSNRIIVPYTFDNKIVGHISRYLDDRIPKYIKEQQPGYIFGYDLQKPDWQVCIVVEGVLDALSINGCALTHDDISEEQAYLLKKLNRRIIIVPDLDKTGLTLCDKALDLGFEVSIPKWGPDVKDTNDAIRKYGKVPTLLSILQSATHSKIKVELSRRQLAKRI